MAAFARFTERIMNYRSTLSEWLADPSHLVKMHGSGNDFVMVDLRNNRAMDNNRTMDLKLRQLAVDLCDRHSGVGADGLIGIANAREKDGENEMIFKNPDGSDAGMCGNGARCFAALVSVLSGLRDIRFVMGGNRYQATVFGGDDRALLDGEFPEVVEIEFPGEISVEHRVVEGQDLSMVYSGTEHVIVRTNPSRLDDVGYIRERGSYWRSHDAFVPSGTNVNFMAPAGEDPWTCKVRTFERGVENLTLSCGTGAIASALALHSETGLGLGAKQRRSSDAGEASGESEFCIKVDQLGGTVEVSFLFDEQTKRYRRIRLKGPVAFVFMAQMLF